MRTKSRPAKERPPADFEEVKRRFTRQNRDLARVNSTQALQIQNLRSEVDKLVAQNQDLKELVLRLQGELQSTRTNARGVQAKFAELSSLIAGLSSASDGSHKEQLLSQDAIRSTTPRQYRERQPLGELMQDLLMPTIAEHKSFPRETLDTEDIWNMRLSDHSSNESPDLGPPPVARLIECEEPIAYVGAVPSEPEQTALDSTQSDAKEGDSVMASVETRKKRKEGPSRLEVRRSSILALSPVKTDDGESGVILRTGAKRKLVDRETDNKPGVPSRRDDFLFSRRPASEEPIAASDEEIVVKMDRRQLHSSPVKPSRRVLTDKSTNMSPRKAVSVASKVEKPSRPAIKDMSDADKRDRAPIRAKRASAVTISSPPRKRPSKAMDVPPPSKVLPLDEVPSLSKPEPQQEPPLEPNTPYNRDSDLFSPPPSDTSLGIERTNRDTPPPSTLMNMINNSEAANAARPSRRARSAVNYAEPSLVAKMRRPGKEMVDAISGLQDPRSVMSTSTSSTDARRRSGSIGGSALSLSIGSGEGSVLGSATVPKSSVTIKNEVIDEDVGMDLASPLNDKSASMEVESESASATCAARRSSTAPMMAQVSDIAAAPTANNTRKRRESSTAKSRTDDMSSTIRVATSSSSIGQQGEPPIQKDKPEDFDIYEFRDSSTSSSSLSLGSSSPARSSSTSASASSKPQHPTSSTTTATGRLNRRHSSAVKDVSFPSSTAPSTTVALSSEKGRREARASLASAGPVVASSESGAATSTRAERTMSRRRSMML